jgi:cytochrome P450
MRRASVVDTLRVGFSVIVPIVAQGVILRRPRMVALAARLDADRRAGALLRRLRSRYGPGPLRLRVPGRPVVLVLSVPDVRTVLSGTPEPYAPANREKVAALSHFQPHGVLVSRGRLRAERRALNEAVLDTGEPVHRLGPAIEATIRDELDHADLTGVLTWDRFRQLWWRVVRRTVLGHGARDDRPLIAMLDALRADANWAWLKPPRTALRRRFEERLAGHLSRAEPGSLAGILARTPADFDVDPAGQVPHWLFAFDAAGIAAYRALALLALDPDAPVQAAVLESVRLWPTTMVILRDSTATVDGVPAGSAYVIVTSYFHRDPDALDEPDRFTPDLWLTGQAEDNWALMPFSRGPAMCPGRNLVLFTTGTLLTGLRERYHLEPAPALDPNCPLPGTYHHAGLRFTVTARALDPVQ